MSCGAMLVPAGVVNSTNIRECDPDDYWRQGGHLHSCRPSIQENGRDYDGEYGSNSAYNLMKLQRNWRPETA